MVMRFRVKILSCMLILLFLCSVITPAGMMALSQGKSPIMTGQKSTTADVEYLVDWQYRKSHEITGLPTDGSDYQVKIIVHYDFGTDSGENVFLGKRCQTDFDDVRFTKSDGSSQLSYWMDESDYAPGDYAVFWIRLEDCFSISQIIYIYYGNLDVGSKSNGEDTFLFFDDFPGSSLDTTNKWTIAQGAVEVSGGLLHVDGAVGSNKAYFYTQDGWGDGIKQHVRAIVNTPHPCAMRCVSFIDTDYDWHDFIDGQFYGASNEFRGRTANDFQIGGGYSDFTYVTLSSITQWHEYSCYWTLDEVGWTQEDVDSDPFLTRTTLIPDNIEPPSSTEPLSVFFSEAGVVGDDMDVDWVFVRNYHGADAGHGDWGDREFSDGTFDTASWKYRKAHEIIGVQGLGTNYQVKFIVRCGSGTDTGETVYLDGKCEDDFDDIRFTASDGLSLSHWRETGANYDPGVKAVFWVRVSSNLDVDQTIYIYYGNEYANSGSDGEDTFLFFDDFPGSSLDTTNKWTIAQGAVEVSGGLLHVDGAVGSNKAYFYTQDGWGDGIKQHVRAIVNTPHPCAMRCVSFIDTDYDWNDFIDGQFYGGTNRFRGRTANDFQIGGGYSDFTYVTIGDITQWHEYSCYWTLDEVGWTQEDVDSDPFLIMTTPIPDNIEPPSGTEPLSVFFCEAGVVGDDMDVDWVFVRKYTGSEPEHGEWGPRELSNGVVDMSEWTYWKPHRINGATGAGTNYQMYFKVYYDKIYPWDVDNGHIVYLDGLCKTDFSDVRFVDRSGRLLNYWIMQRNAAVANIWVEIQDSLNSGEESIIFIYYGNEDAQDASDGERTFLLFDDFSSPLDSSKWDWSGPSVSNGELVIPQQNRYIESEQKFGPKVAMQARVKMGGNMRHNMGFGLFPTADYLPHLISHSEFASISERHLFDGWHQSSSHLTMSPNIWDYWSVAWKSNYGRLYECYPWGELGNYIELSESDIPDTPQYMGFSTWGSADSSLYVDWVFLRKWIVNEPQHGEWGTVPSYNLVVPAPGWGSEGLVLINGDFERDENNLDSWDISEGWSVSTEEDYNYRLNSLTTTFHSAYRQISEGRVEVLGQTLGSTIRGSLKGQTIEASCYVRGGASETYDQTQIAICYDTHEVASPWFGRSGDSNNPWIDVHIEDLVPENIDDMWIEIRVRQREGKGSGEVHVDAVQVALVDQISISGGGGNAILSLRLYRSFVQNNVETWLTASLSADAYDYGIGGMYLRTFLIPYVGGLFPYTNQWGHSTIECLSEGQEFGPIKDSYEPADWSNRATSDIISLAAIGICGLAGSLAGAAIGTAICPGPGTGAGAVFGAFIGEYIGEVLVAGVNHFLEHPEGEAAGDPACSGDSSDYYTEIGWEYAWEYAYGDMPTWSDVTNDIHWQYNPSGDMVDQYALLIEGYVMFGHWVGYTWTSTGNYALQIVLSV